MAGRYLCETCFDAMTNHVVDVRGFEEAVCDACIGGPDCTDGGMGVYEEYWVDANAYCAVHESYDGECGRIGCEGCSLADPESDTRVIRVCMTSEGEEVFQIDMGERGEVC